MKKVLFKFIAWCKSWKEQIADIKVNDRKNTILDQMLFGLSTEESIELYNSVLTAFNSEMEQRKQEAIEEHRIISGFFRDGLR